MNDLEDHSILLKTQGRAPGLDLLRVLAVALVIVFHYSIESKGLMFTSIGKYGWMGVDLFFVLSGFLIGSQLFRQISKGEIISFKNFFLRRLLRTLPNFLAVLSVYFCFSSLRERPILAPLWKYLTFTQNIGLSRQATGAFSHAWSLCVEEQFYFFLPLIVLIFWKKISEKKIVLIIISIFFFGIILRSSIWLGLLVPVRNFTNNFGSLYDQYIYYPTYTRLDGLLVGITLALIKTFKLEQWERLLKNGVVGIVFASIMLGTAFYLNQYKYSLVGSALLYPLVSLGFGALLIACLSPKFYISYIKIPGVTMFATLSYAIYLIQKLVFHWCENNLQLIGVQPFSILGFFLTMAICLLVALTLYLLIERPFLKLRDHLMRSSIKNRR